MPDPYDQCAIATGDSRIARRLAASAIAYALSELSADLHACGCGRRRDPAGERRVLEAFVHASGAVIRQPSNTGEDT
jgi:hypothetical protein